MAASAERLIRWFADVSIDDIESVGGKNASLGELVRELAPQGIAVPDGFALTADAYRLFLASNQLQKPIAAAVKRLQAGNIESLQRVGAEIRELMLAAPLPDELSREILAAYHKLSKARGGLSDVAVRSSATAEDLPEASFAGQQETFLNVQGDAALLGACRRCFASLFTDRAISYRERLALDHLQVALSVGVQEMVRSDLSVSGVLFTLDTESGFRDVVLINASYGLGENIVQGNVTPDEFLVFKPTLDQGTTPILLRRCGSKEIKLIYDDIGAKSVRNTVVPLEDRIRLCVSDEEVLTLARWGCLIEQHYSKRSGRDTPMDIEWAKDGRTGKLYILQARPETVHSAPSGRTLTQYTLKEPGEILIEGSSIGEKIASGPVRIIRSVHDIERLAPGEIMVSDRTDPDWEPAMKRASAVVTNSGGRTCHAAIVSREFGIPAIVGTERATQVLQDGQQITVSCAEGAVGKVYRGALAFDKTSVELSELPTPRTKMMLNVGNPHGALALSFLPHHGVGLARMEFIITNAIGIHPLALLDFDTLPSEVKDQIAGLTGGYLDKSKFFVDRLSEGIGTIAAAFYPHDVIVRFSDFKTNEYADLIGGKQYEPSEENPMLGFRGASRYYHPAYERAFALECRAIQIVREQMGLRNVKVMIPFCRTVEEGRKVLAVMARHQLRRGEQGLEVYLMCEIPANVVLAEDFAEICDGFSIGSNDLTQLLLGVDRDSAIVAPLFDERNEAVMRAVADVIRRVKKCGKKVGICGQAPSDYPEFTRFLVEQGIDSISLNPDALIKMITLVDNIERDVAAPRGSRPTLKEAV